ncbi:MAG: hypothetical protein Q8O56_07205 [Solirubrobacteraceae bacterium]|nr:hypothetical protein [Solirubrobacteraceae bacterium]
MQPTGVIPRQIASETGARAAASRLAAAWRDGALERDRDPWQDDGALDALASSGLLGALLSTADGGLGPSAALIADVIRVLATGDPALAQQVHGHIHNVALLAFAPPAVGERIARDIRDAGARFGNVNHDPSGGTVLQPLDGDGGHLLDGVKTYCTGVVGAAWLAVPAALPGERLRVALVAADADGVDVGTDWDAFGQRATRSVTTRFEQVFVAADHVIDPWRDPLAAHLRELRSQLPHVALEVGIAEAVLAEPWPASTRLREGFDAAAAHVAAARALLDESAQRVDEASAQPTRATVGEAALVLLAARALAYRTSVRAADAATRWLGDEPARAARIDLHWRNARTHSVHDPGRWAFHHVGAHVLSGRFPSPRSPGLRERAAEIAPEPAPVPAVPQPIVAADLDELEGALARIAREADVARAALADAARFVADRSRACPEAGVQRAADEPHAILRFGELAVALRALDALVARAAASDNDPAAVESAERHADRVVLRIVSDAYEIAGASALTRERGLHHHRRRLLALRAP